MVIGPADNDTVISVSIIFSSLANVSKFLRVLMTDNDDVEVISVSVCSAKSRVPLLVGIENMNLRKGMP